MPVFFKISKLSL